MKGNRRHLRRPVGGSTFLVIALVVAVLLVGFRLLTNDGLLKDVYGPDASAGPAVSAGPATGAPSGSSRATSGGSGAASSVPRVPAGARVPEARRVANVNQQHGIQIYLHEVKPNGPADHTAAILDYVVWLGANSIGLSFPIYTDGARPTKVAAGAETPSPEQVKRVVDQAHERGLRVMLRPIIDEENIAQTRGQWRGSIRPVDTAVWFRSYSDTIAAYFHSGADEVVLASELTSLQHATGEWARVEARARKGFSGKLSFAFNWDATSASSSSIDLYGLDLYFPVPLGDDASVAQLASGLRRAIEAQPAAVRARLVVQEVGIAAVSGMYATPWNWGSRSHAIKQEIQGNWFAAACSAVRDLRAKGIYYWMLDSNVDPLTADPAAQPAGSFIGRLGERSIKACFAS